MTAPGISSDPRVARLTAARRQASVDKRQRTLAALTKLAAAQEPISISALARHAHVSTWFIYNTPEIDSAVRRAITDQHTRALSSASRKASTTTPDSLRTDLALARREIIDLRNERDVLTRRLQLVLGAQIEQVPHEQLVKRIEDQHNQINQLQAERDEALARATTAEKRCTTVEDELGAARSSLKRMMQQNSPGRI